LTTVDIFERYEIIAVDDRSRDNTAEVLKRMMNKFSFLRVKTHPRNLGYGKALMSGFKISQYRMVLFMDADAQLDISEITKLLPLINTHDIITGVRYKRKDKLYRVVLAKFYSWIVFFLFGLKIKDLNCGFKLFKKEVLANKYIHSRAGVFYTEIFLRAKIEGYKIREVDIRHFPRFNGKPTGASPKTIFEAVVDLIKLRYRITRYKVKSRSG
jgi:glycosyltransferase involved in cell wall biosynthesis